MVAASAADSVGQLSCQIRQGYRSSLHRALFTCPISTSATSATRRGAETFIRSSWMFICTHNMNKSATFAIMAAKATMTARQ